MQTKRGTRLTAIITVIMVFMVLLAGCGSKSTDTNDKSLETTAVGEQTATPAPVETKEPVVIKWATWENIIMAKEMAAKFNERNKDIKVEIDDFGGWFGNDQLTKRAASGEMPDVFNVENPSIPIQNKWVLDLKPYLDKETDKKFYDNFVATGTFEGKVVMLPSYIFVNGMVVNKSLLKANNLPIPEYGWTLDEYKDIVTKTTKGKTIGTNSVADLMKHIPSQINDSLGWGCWDGSKYVLGDEWKYAVDFTKDLFDKKVAIWQLTEHINPWDKPEGAERDAAFKQIADIYKDKFGEESDWNVYMKGNVATWLEFSWGIGFDKDPAFGGWEWDFYPFPVKDKGDVSRPGIVSDSLAISSSAKNPDEAFRLIKYLSYDPAAYDDRVDIIKNYKKEDAMVKYADISADRFSDTLIFNHIPAINDQSVRDKWGELNGIKPGLKYIINNLDKGYIDGFKFVPDFDNAYHKTIEKTVREQVFTGKKTAADLSAELEKKANDMTQTAIANMKK